MTKFETIKELVTVRQAAEHYGLNVNRSNMCRCPFHSDQTPSMKIYDKNYHCFGCGAHGDVIDLTFHLWLMHRQAAPIFTEVIPVGAPKTL